MSRRLVLMRHAKSSWKSEAATDHARPLNDRGRRDAPRMAAALRTWGWWPDLVLASDAVRTQQTWAAMAEGQPDVPIRLEPTLYLGGEDELRAVLRAAPSDVQTLLVLGHNPGWEESLTWLSGSQEPMTTANAALLATQDDEWGEAVASCHRFELLTILRPKELPSTGA